MVARDLRGRGRFLCSIQTGRRPGHSVTGTSLSGVGMSMACTCVVGLQWGDEAKGKIVDLLTDRHDFVVRYNGGANAGHTVVSGGQTSSSPCCPPACCSPHVRSVIGNGVVVYPPRFLEEVANLRTAGIAVGDNLVAQRPRPRHLPLSHGGRTPQRSRARSRRSAPPAAASARATRTRSAASCGIRVGELLHPEHLRERLAASSCRARTALLRALSPEARHVRRRRPVPRNTWATPSRCGRYITDTTRLLHQALRGRQAHPVRGGPGQPARRGSRHLSLRDQLQQLDGRHLERLGRAGPEPGPRGRRHQGLHHARRPRALPDRAERRPRRHRRTHPPDRPRVRHRDRPAAPLRLVRRRGRPLHGRPGRRRRAGGDAARRAERAGRVAHLHRLRAGRRAPRLFPERCLPAGALPAGLRDAAGLAHGPVRRPASWPTCRPPPGATWTASASCWACRCRSSPWGRIGSRRSFVRMHVARSGEPSDRIAKPPFRTGSDGHTLASVQLRRQLQAPATLR